MSSATPKACRARIAYTHFARSLLASHCWMRKVIVKCGVTHYTTIDHAENTPQHNTPPQLSYNTPANNRRQFPVAHPPTLRFLGVFSRLLLAREDGPSTRPNPRLNLVMVCVRGPKVVVLFKLAHLVPVAGGRWVTSYHNSYYTLRRRVLYDRRTKHNKFCEIYYTQAESICVKRLHEF